MIRLIHRVPVYLLSAGLVLFALPGLAEDTDDLVIRCEICHGQDGNSELPMFPSISGFSYEGFLYAMEVYREDRSIAAEFQQPNKPETVMNNIAQQLSEADLEGLANYFSKRKYIPRSQAFDPELASRGAILHEDRCEQCHVENGTKAGDEVAPLAGQWTLYLRMQFDNILSGKRIVPRRMLNRIKKLNPEDIEALLNYYASLN